MGKAALRKPASDEHPPLRTFLWRIGEHLPLNIRDFSQLEEGEQKVFVIRLHLDRVLQLSFYCKFLSNVNSGTNSFVVSKIRGLQIYNGNRESAVC